MALHISHSYLNSCLNVPLDPCSNCPAPVFNRPKIYLGSLTATPITTPSSNTIKCNTLAKEAKSFCNGIRSLAKFYDSIPDYRELNHLNGTEFYSALDTLRSTCRQLKDTPVSCINSEDQCSITTTTSSSLTSFSSGFGQSHCKKTKKSKKKTKCSVSQNNQTNNEIQEPKTIQEFPKTKISGNNEEDIGKLCYSPLFNESLKKDLAKEIEDFKKSLQEFEAEFKRSHSSSSLKEGIKKSFEDKGNLADKLNKNKNKLLMNCSNATSSRVPVRNTFTSQLRERLRKSLSYNDLSTITEPLELLELRKKNKTLEFLSYKGYRNVFEDSSKLSHYFQKQSKPENTSVPKITVDSPENSKKISNVKKLKKKQNKNNEEEYKAAFTLFDLEPSKKDHSFKLSTPSPVHPVARPNLAATLRVESSKKKVQELKNNCTYKDTTPQFDWEVRKTPAWKTLSFNESHKNILRLRLATRKAEQALQQREYELNMELMRQRVKSAPLLLEGPTYWGPYVGKLSHTCQKEGRRHMCQSNQQHSKRKKNSSRSQSCRRSFILNSSSPLDCENVVSSPRTYTVQTESRSSQKFNTLRKIYGAGGTKSRSRNSNYSTNSQQSFKNSNKKNSGHYKPYNGKPLQDNVESRVEIDSGDELSSLDRAFL